ncbi:MAG: zf-HC2 domain-containing protein, partial [Chloroflexi bacterium]|nr:zf-HC2 domain-containing protein [Chloroflexota bacterium]
MSAPPNILSDHDLELLSAYLDGELTDRETYNLEQRLAREEVLRLTLDDLRDTVMLVQSLPRLHAPHNFTLDPARYGRKIPWWRRWFSAERGLQWAGALGTIASIVLIAVGLLLSSANETMDMAESQPEEESSGYAAASAPTIQPDLGSTAIDDTAIAYSGDDHFQSTLAMQSAYYGGTETAEATLTSPSMKDESTPPHAAPAAAAAVEESPPVVEMAVGGETDAILSPTATGTGAGQSLNLFNTVESSPAEGMMEADGMVQGAGAVPEDQQTFAMD